jgi:hypothetical protein
MQYALRLERIPPPTPRLGPCTQAPPEHGAPAPCPAVSSGAAPASAPAPAAPGPAHAPAAPPADAGDPAPVPVPVPPTVTGTPARGGTLPRNGQAWGRGPMLWRSWAQGPSGNRT